MKILFLDVDGVLNTHKAHRNGYTSLDYFCVQNLCTILEGCPDVKIVLSSAWRYLIPSHFTLAGFEYLLCMFGADFDAVNGRVIGCTPSDEDMMWDLGICERGAPADWDWMSENGKMLRREQIMWDVNYKRLPDKITQFVVLDDLDLEMPELIKTDPNAGLTTDIALRVVKAFQSDF